MSFLKIKKQQGKLRLNSGAGLMILASQTWLSLKHEQYGLSGYLNSIREASELHSNLQQNEPMSLNSSVASLFAQNDTL